ncbi:glutathione S-transferase family protein [Pseudomonas gingeri]
MSTTLVIGDYNSSSWSFRAWLVLKAAGVSFEVVKVKLGQENTRAQILKYSPSGKVPALLTEGVVINDSLAIAEYIAHLHPEAQLWPQYPIPKALARAAVAEMHSGFSHLRTQLSFGLSTGDMAQALTVETKEEIQRIFSLWSDLRTRSASSRFLCGEFGIVDAMFVPVVFRFRRYGIAVPDALQDYVAQVLEHPLVQEWQQLADEEA